MRAIWKGAISFGLINIPISLFPAIRREDLKFRLLRRSDMSPVNYKRVASADGKEVPWDEIVKGYEYEKEKFVVLKDEDFKRVDIEATQTVDILTFVEIKEVNPLLFYKPYYMEPAKGGDKAYVLLRETLDKTGKIAIAKVVLKSRQHLAAVKPQNDGLMLELMHFPEEVLDSTEFKAPRAKTAGKPEVAMAMKLVESMTEKWQPEKYKDDYREALEEMIEDKIEHGGKQITTKPRPKNTSNVIDLVSVLKKSLEQSGAKVNRAPRKTKPTAVKRPTQRTKAA